MKQMTVSESLDILSALCAPAKSPTLDEAMGVIRKAVETGAQATNNASLTCDGCNIEYSGMTERCVRCTRSGVCIDRYVARQA